METRDVVTVLGAAGFARHGYEVTLDGTVTGPAVAAYQRSFAGRSRSDWLKIDGIAGPITQSRLQEWETRLSPHFGAREFTDHRAGITLTHRELVSGLELLRNAAGHPISIASGYRTARTNALVKGASRSQHLFGLGVDIKQRPRLSMVARLRVFSGIGDRGGFVIHVDVRHVDRDTNPTPRATPSTPARWSY